MCCAAAASPGWRSRIASPNRAIRALLATVQPLLIDEPEAASYHLNMASQVPEHLIQEQQAVEAQIHEAFRGVTRTGGWSWSEARVIDAFGTEEEMIAAQDQDHERCWEDLVDDPDWDESPGMGGFNFLDDISYAYYIAPAMIRCTRRGHGESIGYALTVDSDLGRLLVSRINPIQARAIARFVRFMIATNDEIYGESWKHAYEVYWQQWDGENTSQQP
jgi:hypothetical protein